MTQSDIKDLPEPPESSLRRDAPKTGVRKWSDAPVLVTALLLFQVLCTVVLVFDVTREVAVSGWDVGASFHLVPEILAVNGLILATVFVALVLRRILDRQRKLEKGMSVATGALAAMIEGYFTAWALTPAEQAVATFTIKGYSIAEIAGLRGSAEGTIKTHLNAIYRKAGVTGRAQLVSMMVEELLAESLIVPG